MHTRAHGGLAREYKKYALSRFRTLFSPFSQQDPSEYFRKKMLSACSIDQPAVFSLENSRLFDRFGSIRGFTLRWKNGILSHVWWRIRARLLWNIIWNRRQFASQCSVGNLFEDLLDPYLISVWRLNWKHIFSLPVSRVVSRYIIGNEVTSKMPRAAAPDTFSLRRDSKLLRIEFRRKIDSNGERERRAFSRVGCDRSVHLQDQSFFTGLVGANEFTGTALQIRRFAFVHLCGEPASRSTSLSIINPRARAEEGTRQRKAKEDIDRETR